MPNQVHPVQSAASPPTAATDGPIRIALNEHELAAR